MLTSKPPLDKIMASHLKTGIQTTLEIIYTLVVFQKMAVVVTMDKTQHNVDITHNSKKEEIGTPNFIVFLITQYTCYVGFHAFNFSSFCAKEHNTIYGLKQYIMQKAI
jgi:hypothetical protein